MGEQGKINVCKMKWMWLQRRGVVIPISALNAKYTQKYKLQENAIT